MKLRLLVCIDCRAERISASKAIRCSKCSHEFQNNISRNRIKASLEALGHVNIHFPEVLKNGKIAVQFTHSVCSTEQSWQASNITKRLAADPTIAPCRVCGGKRRAALGSAGYIAKYGITRAELADFRRYSQKVRSLSDTVYRHNKAEINPQGFKRGVYDYHLDHKIPIIEGFRLNKPPEEMAVKENLQMLPAFDNLSKGRNVNANPNH
jgi:hypothetical protein